LAVAGISIISWKGENSLLMLINASIAGTGYGLFSVSFKMNRPKNRAEMAAEAMSTTTTLAAAPWL
jgi:hypothetical protein